MDGERESSGERMDYGEAVIIDEDLLGREFSQFELSNLTERMQGVDKFNEVFLETSSGNIYCIVAPSSNLIGGPKLEGVLEGLEGQRTGIMVVNARQNEGKGRESKGTVLTDQEISSKVLKVGGSFEFGQGNRTTSIRRITCVNGSKHFTENGLRMAGGKTSDVRKRFREIIKPKK